MNSTIKMVITDLDGTLLNDKNLVSKKDYQTLEKLKSKNIYRVIATGRNLHSVRKVIAPDFPVDYVIFSCGAGIINWNNQELMLTKYLTVQQVKSIVNVLENEKIDFMVHELIPDNHCFIYQYNSGENIDFEARLKRYEKYISPFDSKNEIHPSSEVLAVIPNKLELFNRIVKLLHPEKNSLSIIRATSPIDQAFMWLEIFPNGVTKGGSLNWLCRYLNVKQQNTLSVGNDYNDLAMLDWTAHSFVVDNAPDDLKSEYNITSSHLENGFTNAVNELMENKKEIMLKK